MTEQSIVDPELKTMMAEVKQQLAEGNTIKSAVQQLEEQLRNVPQTIESKLAAIRRMQFDDFGRYRGVLGSEEVARGFGLFVMAMAGRDERAASALRSEFKDIAERALGTDTEAGGGGLVPIEYSARIQRLVEEFGVFAANAFPMPMTESQLTFQRRKTGLTVYKTGEGNAVTESSQTFETINLNADEWNTLTLYPKAMGMDAAAAIGEMIALDIGQAFAQATDDAGFIGDGTPTYLDVQGVTHRLKAINGVDDGGGLVLASGNQWSEITENDLRAVIGRAPRYAQRNGKWYMSNAFYWEVGARLILAAGGVTASDIEGRRALQLFGYEVEVTQSMPASEANSQVCALFGDLRLSSTHGTRQQLTIDHDTSVKFLERQVAVLGTRRHAISNHSLGDADNAGPIVGLVTASS